MNMNEMKKRDNNIRQI